MYLHELQGLASMEIQLLHQHLFDVCILPRIGDWQQRFLHHGLHTLALQEVPLYEPQHVGRLQGPLSCSLPQHPCQHSLVSEVHM